MRINVTVTDDQGNQAFDWEIKDIERENLILPGHATPGIQPVVTYLAEVAN